MDSYEDLLSGDVEQAPGQFERFIAHYMNEARGNGYDRLYVKVEAAHLIPDGAGLLCDYKEICSSTLMFDEDCEGAESRLHRDVVGLLSKHLGEHFEGKIRVRVYGNAKLMGTLYFGREREGKMLASERNQRIARVVAHYKTYDRSFELSDMGEDHADALMQIGEAVSCDSPAWPDVVRAVKDVVEGVGDVDDTMERLGLELHVTGSVPVEPLPPIGEATRITYQGGCDLFLVLAMDRLDSTSGIPEHLRAPTEQVKGLILGFDAANNGKRNASFHAEHMVVDLSFDRLYAGCVIPWSAVVQINVRGEASYEVQPDDGPDDDGVSAEDSRDPDTEDFLPTLRLVD